MKLRSAISLDLVEAGYASGTKEFRNAYQRELRKRNPDLRKREREKWRNYYYRKKAEDPSWNNQRLAKWRAENPEKWQALMKRASEKGLHSRWYANHRLTKNEWSKEYGKRKRRENPAFGLRSEIAKARRSGDVGELLETLMRAIDRFDERGN